MLKQTAILGVEVTFRLNLALSNLGANQVDGFGLIGNEFEYI